VSTPVLDDALQLKRAGDLDGAVIALEGVLSRSPAHPIALTHLADVQLRRGRLAEAAGALDRAEAAGGTTLFTARLRGDLSYKAGRFDEAARHYQDADSLGEKGTWSLVQLARCRLRLKDLDGARGAASRAVERDDGASAAWVLLGDIASSEDRLDEAEAMYGKAHENAPGDDWAYAKLVEVRLQRLPAAKRDRELQVLMKSTGKGNRHLPGVLARLRSQEGDLDAAANAWGAQARRGDLFARKQEGFALRKAGRLEEAAAILGPCLVTDPEDRFVFSSYVSLQKKRGALDELRQTLGAALPRAGSRRGAFYGELRKLPAPDTAP
jgi:predicted Zn-dependent protease